MSSCLLIPGIFCPIRYLKIGSMTFGWNVRCKRLKVKSAADLAISASTACGITKFLATLSAIAADNCCVARRAARSDVISDPVIL